MSKGSLEREVITGYSSAQLGFRRWAVSHVECFQRFGKHCCCHLRGE